MCKFTYVCDCVSLCVFVRVCLYISVWSTCVYVIVCLDMSVSGVCMCVSVVVMRLQRVTGCCPHVPERNVTPRGRHNPQGGIMTPGEWVSGT